MKKILIVFFLIIISSNYSFTQQNNPLSAPNNFQAVVSDTNVVILRWSSVGSGISYIIYFSQQNDSSRAEIIDTISTNTYTIPGLSNGTYYFWVRAQRNNQRSDFSPVQTVRITDPPLPIPQNLRVRVTENGNITLTWDNAGTGTSYKMYWSTHNDSSRASALEGSTTRTSWDLTIPVGTTYYFWVTSIRSGQESQKSRNVSVLIPVASTSTTLSGIYIFGTTDMMITFTGNNFRITSSGFNDITGTYHITNTSLLLNGHGSSASWVTGRWTIVNSNIIRDPDGDDWTRQTQTQTATSIITINTHPNSTTYLTAGNITGSLTVSASVTPSASLSYQWYRNTTNSNTAGNPISGETRNIFIIPTNLTENTYYYYCIIPSGTVSVRSNVARVIVNAPTIQTTTTSQPRILNLHQRNDWELSLFASLNEGDKSLVAGSVGFYGSLFPYTFFGAEAKIGSRADVVDNGEKNSDDTSKTSRENEEFYISISPVVGFVYKINPTLTFFGDLTLELGTLGVAPGFGFGISYTLWTLKYRGMLYNGNFSNSFFIGVSIPHNFW